jgi:tRNA pseudouridine55 synthase
VTLSANFRGLIEQMPPPFSAKKIHGVPAYKLARKKKEVKLQPVQVEIKEFEILRVEGDRARFRARVASGTYMRSVAHEMGQKLGCGAHLESLRRTAVAEFSIADARTLEELEAAANTNRPNPEVEAENTQPKTPQPEKSGAPRSLPQALENLFVHPRMLLPQFPCVTADEVNTVRIRAGRPVNLPELSRARQVKVFSGQRNLIAIATRVAGTLFHPRIVLPSD